MIPIPTNSHWKSNPAGDLFGDMVRTRNIDMSRDGYVSLARKSMTHYSLTENAAFTNPHAIVADSQYAYMINDVGSVNGLFTMDLSDQNLAVVAGVTLNAITMGADSDIVFFQGKPHITGQADMTEVNTGTSGAWHSAHRVTDLSTSYPHPECVSEHQSYLAIGNGNTVRLLDTSYAGVTNLTIPTDYVVTCIRWRANNLYIATRNILGGDAKLFIWNGSGTAAQSGYTVNADWIYSMCEYDSSMTLVTSAGQILRYNGGGFDELAHFPVYETAYSWSSTAATSSLIGKVASRGMQAIGDTLYLNIDGSLNNSDLTGPGSYLPDQPSGLWCYGKDTGLYHKAGYHYKTRNTLIPTEVSSSYLKFSTAHQATTGDAVLAASISGLTGVTSTQIYYAIVDSNASATTCRLALSPANALEGKYVTITGTPSTDRFHFDNYESLGMTKVANPGGLYVFGRRHPNLFFGSEVLFGGAAYDETNTSKGVIQSLGMGRNRGHFITPKILSSRVSDTFQGIIAFFEPLLLSTDEVVIKYRSKLRGGLPTTPFFSGSATWTSATTFTVDSTLKGVGSLEVGDEVEIIRGAAAGYTAHITGIEDSSTTYVYTIDETMPVSSGSFDFLGDNWARGQALTNETETNMEGIAKSVTSTKAPWVQFKFELRGRGTAIRQLHEISVINKQSK